MKQAARLRYALQYAGDLAVTLAVYGVGMAEAAIVRLQHVVRRSPADQSKAAPSAQMRRGPVG